MAEKLCKTGEACPPKTIQARSVACDHEGCYGDCGRTIEVRNQAWIDWHAEIESGVRAMCLVCGKSFEHHELTTDHACSYLCLDCAETMNDPEWWRVNGPKEGD